MPATPPETDRRSRNPDGSEPGIDSAPILGAWRRAARRCLKKAGLETPAVEADLIASHVLGLSRVDLTLGHDRGLTDAERDRLNDLVRRRRTRIPIQYLLGTVEFWGLSLRVDPAVLIPRPETEGLVEHVLAFLGPDPEGTVLDVGTGSGAISLALLSECPRLRIWASDVSPAAVRLALENAGRLELSNRIHFFVGNLTAPLAGTDRSLRAVVSNPPYVNALDRGSLPPEVGHEPPEALFADRGGMDCILRLVPSAAGLLPPGGLLALEIGEDLGSRVRELLMSGPWEDVRIEKDLAGKDRYALGVRAEP